MNKKIFGILLVGTGLAWALLQFTEFRMWGIAEQFWPLFIIVPGLAILLFANTVEAGNWSSAFGAVVLATGLLLAYQSVFDHYQSWAYAWALVTPGALGLGLLIHAKRFGVQSQASLAIKLMSTGAALFIVGVVFFEVLINISGRSTYDGGINGYAIPVALVGAGLIVLWMQPKNRAKNSH